MAEMIEGEGQTYVTKEGVDLKNDAHVIAGSSLHGVDKDRGLRASGVVHADEGCAKVLLHAFKVLVHAVDRVLVCVAVTVLERVGEALEAIGHGLRAPPVGTGHIRGRQILGDLGAIVGETLGVAGRNGRGSRRQGQSSQRQGSCGKHNV